MATDYFDDSFVAFNTTSHSLLLKLIFFFALFSATSFLDG